MIEENFLAGHGERAHAKLSASGSERWLECPGSVALSENAPPQGESEYAKEGTTAHECLEFVLKNRKNLKAAERMALKKYPAEMVTHAIESAKYILGRLDEIGGDLMIETRVDLSFVGPDMFGTLDAAIVEEFGRLVIIDYKYGAGIAVDPEENSQLLYYALGIAKLYHFNFAEVELVVVQPRAFHESGETIRSWVTPIETLIEWEAKFRAGVEAVEDPFAPLKSGDWCRFCPARITCPEIKDQAMRNAQIAFSDADGVESLPAPNSIAVPNLSTILDSCDRLEKWIDSVREHALHVLNRGEKIEGWKLVEKRSIRKWVDEAKAARDAKRILGDLAFEKPKLLSPAKIEAAAKKIESEKLDRAVERFIKARVTDRSSGVTLVRESDRREAVNAIEAAFGPVEPDPSETAIKLIDASKGELDRYGALVRAHREKGETDSEYRRRMIKTMAAKIKKDSKKRNTRKEVIKMAKKKKKTAKKAAKKKTSKKTTKKRVAKSAA